MGNASTWGFLKLFCCENTFRVYKKTIKNLLDAVGIDCDDEKAKIVVEQLKGKSIEDLLAEGSTKLASMPTGGGGGASAGGAAPAAAAGGGAEAAPKEEKK